MVTRGPSKLALLTNTSILPNCASARADDALRVHRVTDIAGCTGDHAAAGADIGHRFVDLGAITRTDKNFGACYARKPLRPPGRCRGCRR